MCSTFAKFLRKRLAEVTLALIDFVISLVKGSLEDGLRETSYLSMVFLAIRRIRVVKRRQQCYNIRDLTIERIGLIFRSSHRLFINPILAGLICDDIQ